MNSLFPVLCIPRAFSNINETRIRKIFDQLQLGVINKVDIKCADKEGKFNRVFIHFKSWENNDNAKQAKLRLDEGKEIKIIYDEPWFWKVSAYRQYSKPAAFQQNKNQQNHKINQVKKPTIQFDCENESKNDQASVDFINSFNKMNIAPGLPEALPEALPVAPALPVRVPIPADPVSLSVSVEYENHDKDLQTVKIEYTKMPVLKKKKRFLVEDQLIYNQI